MINIKNKKCLHENCKTQPCFNYEGESKATYCGEHKLKDMIDIIHKKCQHENCKKIPTFNYEGDSKAIFLFRT